MSTPSGDEPVAQTGRPPVPPPVPVEAPTDGSAQPRNADPDETGVLDLRGYPPRVPGRDNRPDRAEDGEDGADRGR
jgi:hypothetical protein